MLDPCANELSTAKAFQLLYKNRRSVECYKDVSCLQKTISSLIEVHASQLPNQRSDAVDNIN